MDLRSCQMISLTLGLWSFAVQSENSETVCIHESIQLEADYPDKYYDKKVPILDIEIWVDTERRVMHQYYSKQVSSMAVSHAIQRQDRRTILTQDLLEYSWDADLSYLGVRRRSIYIFFYVYWRICTTYAVVRIWRKHQKGTSKIRIDCILKNQEESWKERKTLIQN